MSHDFYIEYISKQIGITPIKETDNFKDDLGLDSLSLLKLMLNCHHHYKMSYENNSILNIETVKDLIDLIIINKKEENI